MERVLLKHMVKYNEVLSVLNLQQVLRHLMMGKQLPDIATNIESGMYRYPVGVVGGITPFNFPMMVPCWMFPLAIAWVTPLF